MNKLDLDLFRDGMYPFSVQHSDSRTWLTHRKALDHVESQFNSFLFIECWHTAVAVRGSMKKLQDGIKSGTLSSSKVHQTFTVSWLHPNYLRNQGRMITSLRWSVSLQWLDSLHAGRVLIRDYVHGAVGMVFPSGKTDFSVIKVQPWGVESTKYVLLSTYVQVESSLQV